MGDLERKITLMVISLASVLVLAAFSINDKAYAQTQPQPGPPFGDFTCWISVQPGNPVSSLHVIEDQFNQFSHQNWSQSEYCTATTKFINGQPTPGPSPFATTVPFPLAQHYQSWFYEDPLPANVVTGQFVNLDVPQFGYDFDTTIGDLDQVMVPATKFTPQLGPVESADKQQHWNCYNISGPSPPPLGIVDLETQHGNIGDVTIFNPFLLCLPMVKDGQFGQLLDEHMVCYDIQSNDDFTSDHPILLADQFTSNTPIPFVIDFASQTFQLGLEKLCVPAFKSFPAVGGFDIPINTSALLLAGVQSISMWMIPVVIAGIGVGIFVLKRRK